MRHFSKRHQRWNSSPRLFGLVVHQKARRVVTGNQRKSSNPTFPVDQLTQSQKRAPPAGIDVYSWIKAPKFVRPLLL